MSEELIYKKINEVMNAIEAIGKDKKNTQQNFKYRGIDDVMNELHPVLAKCGVFITPNVLDEQRTKETSSSGKTLFYTRLKICFTFYATDGSHIETVVIGEAMDSGDKASNKALSVGLKYALLQVFCIPTEDDKDPDAESHEITQPPAEGMKSASKIKKPILKGGESSPEEKQQLKALFESKQPDGAALFTREEIYNFSKTRETKTAAEVIALVQAEVSKRLIPAAGMSPAENAAVNAAFDIF